MQAVISQIHRANMKAMLLTRMNIILVALDAIAMLMWIITWAVSGHAEGVSSRYVACVISFLLLAITMTLSVLVHRMQPKLSLFYAHEVMAVFTLTVTAISMGMNNIVVDLCNRNKELVSTKCGSHVAELLADLIVCLTMAVAYASTQQRLVTFIDKGILDGIKGRSTGGLTQLP